MALAPPYHIYRVILRLIGSDSGLTRRVGCQWFATIRGLGRQRLRVLVPRPVGWEGELPGSGSTIGDEKQRPVPRLSYHASGNPRPNVAENNNKMTIRRIYNKTIESN